MERLIAIILLIGVSSANIPLVTWNGASGTTFDFKELNDPVMGGQSSGTFSVDKGGNYAIFEGEVVDVPSLKAPGFIKASGDGKYNDASSCLEGDLVLSVRSSTPNYTGFRVSFAAGTVSPSYSCAGGGSIALSRGCFKANFSVPAGDDFTEVRVPFKQFSDMWSPATGEHTKECSDDPSVCPTASSLNGIKRIEVWAEGALGKIHLELQSILASSSSSVDQFTDGTRPPTQFDSCGEPAQPDLRFNISTRMDSFGGESAAESMVESVCCDTRNTLLAEPRFLFEAPDIQLFAELEKSTGVTTFYDSVCGVPLFRAPQNRSMAAFQADTVEHGWPSFRSAEVVSENVRTDRSTGLVSSSCGTHLGSYLPDEKGDRWCIDLSCISGHSTKYS